MKAHCFLFFTEPSFHESKKSIHINKRVFSISSNNEHFRLPHHDRLNPFHIAFSFYLFFLQKCRNPATLQPVLNCNRRILHCIYNKITAPIVSAWKLQMCRCFKNRENLFFKKCEQKLQKFSKFNFAQTTYFSHISLYLWSVFVSLSPTTHPVFLFCRYFLNYTFTVIIKFSIIRIIETFRNE